LPVLARRAGIDESLDLRPISACRLALADGAQAGLHADNQRDFSMSTDWCRRAGMHTALPAVALLSILALVPPWASAAEKPSHPARPNVLVIITDDQGYGDLGAHGNATIRTPRLDAFARQSAELTRFYVCPVCSPTRASLLTGRYHYRTGVVDTFKGRSRMFGDEVTLAEALRDAGYRTAIFGKWHLGDNYPARPIDQGFERAVVHRGGGIGQPSDPPEARSYFDPVLQKNGRPVRYHGYCSDIYAEEVLGFLDERSDRPFFAYLAFNAPHEPLEVPEKYLRPYDSAKMLTRKGQLDLATKRVYAMVSNIDENVGKILDKLDQLDLARQTIVVFLTDNGPQYVRYNANLRGLKGSVYDGGIRAPCYLRWPGHFEAGRKVDRVAAHIDLLPTILDCCDVEPPAKIKLDGKTLKPLLLGTNRPWADREIVLQWHRGDVPLAGWACAVRNQRWKLVQAVRPEDAPKAAPRWELYDMEADPSEQHDVSGSQPDVAERLRQSYSAWFAEMKATRSFARPRTKLSAEHENPVVLTRQDMNEVEGDDSAAPHGHWELELAAATQFEVKIRFAEPIAGTVIVECGSDRTAVDMPAPGKTVATTRVRLPAGPLDLAAWAEREGKRTEAYQLELRKIR